MTHLIIVIIHRGLEYLVIIDKLLFYDSEVLKAHVASECVQPPKSWCVQHCSDSIILYFHFLIVSFYSVSSLPLSHDIPLAPFISIINGEIIAYLSNKCYYWKN